MDSSSDRRSLGGGGNSSINDCSIVRLIRHAAAWSIGLILSSSVPQFLNSSIPPPTAVALAEVVVPQFLTPFTHFG